MIASCPRCKSAVKKVLGISVVPVGQATDDSEIEWACQSSLLAVITDPISCVNRPPGMPKRVDTQSYQTRAAPSRISSGQPLALHGSRAYVKFAGPMGWPSGRLRGSVIMAAQVNELDAASVEAMYQYCHDVDMALPGRLDHVVLFGSRARGDNHEQSDWDMAIFIDHFDDRETRTLAFLSVPYDFRGTCISPLGLSSDRSGVSPELLENIDNDGVTIWRRKAD